MKHFNRIYNIYNKSRIVLENIVFPVLLILYPLIGIRQGLDVSDTSYSLSNFQYFATMDGTWMVATFLANAAGWVMMHLPFGNTLLGMYGYTALVQSVTALAAYEGLKKRIPAPLVWIGEMIALGVCWCPSTILYNYLTYLLMTVGVLLLYEGIVQENGGTSDNKKYPEGGQEEHPGGDMLSEDGRKYWKYYVAAGICLGANVAVRMPNVVQTAFILAVWYGVFLGGGSDKWRRALHDTLWCVLGYATGFGVPFAVICVRYGITAYPSMVQTMFAMTEKAADYKPSSMLEGMLGDYSRGAVWLAFAAVCMAGGWLLFRIRRRLAGESRGAFALCTILYTAVLAVLLRFYWGRGVFSFQYYQDGSVYYPVVLFLIVAILMAILYLCRKNIEFEYKVAAVLILVQIFVTPLGSNNYLYPIINNLFLVMPFVLGIGWRQLVGKKIEDTGTTVVWSIPFGILVIFLLVQSVGFHICFSFRDGIRGEKRDTVVEAPVKAAWIYTRQENAAWLSELAEYTEETGLTGRKALFYGDIPGLGYLLDMPSALSTFWPDLDSYRMVEYERDMAQMEETPVVIVASPVAAYLNEDADGMNWFGVEQEAMDADEKLQILGRYLKEHSYRESFGNGQYVVYVTEE